MDADRPWEAILNDPDKEQRDHTAHAAILERTPEAKRRAVWGALCEECWVCRQVCARLPEGTSATARAIHTARPTQEAREAMADSDAARAYPNLVGNYPSYLARLILGETPSEISGGLTRAEAHGWLSKTPDTDPAEWLLRGHFWLREMKGDGLPGARTVTIARWIINAMNDPPRREALTRERTEIGGVYLERYEQAEIGGSYLDRVDELIDADLVPSVEGTFRRAAARARLEYERTIGDMNAPLAEPPAWWRPIRCARLLLTAAELQTEGRAMQHCVGTYAPQVKAGSVVIVALRVPYPFKGADFEHLSRERYVERAAFLRDAASRGGYLRSTVELDRQTGIVRQHRGPGNGPPHELCQRALVVAMHRWGLRDAAMTYLVSLRGFTIDHGRLAVTVATIAG